MTETKRRGRGLGKKPAKQMTSLRLDAFVLEYFKTNHSDNPRAKMREVLTEYVLTKQEKQNETI